MTRSTVRNGNDKPARRAGKDAAFAWQARPGRIGHDELEERIERLEKRLEETIDGMEGSAVVRTSVAVDGKEKDDPLRRAVDRSNEKRDTEK